MEGGDLMTLKDILGHSTLKIVERYAHLAAAHKRKQVNNLNAIFKSETGTIQESSQVVKS
jgi:site-specific recombinase XerD